MVLNAVVFPVLPGKTDEWRQFVAEINDPRRTEFTASRAAAGADERTYLQPTPMGGVATLEADEPRPRFRRGDGRARRVRVGLLERVTALHGVDLAMPMTASPSELVTDTARVLEPPD